MPHCDCAHTHRATLENAHITPIWPHIPVHVASLTQTAITAITGTPTSPPTRSPSCCPIPSTHTAWCKHMPWESPCWCLRSGCSATGTGVWASWGIRDQETCRGDALSSGRVSPSTVGPGSHMTSMRGSQRRFTAPSHLATAVCTLLAVWHPISL